MTNNNDSAVILIIAKNHDEKVGPWSGHVLARKVNDVEVGPNGEKVPPPPVGPRPRYLATEEVPVEEKAERNSYATEGHNQASFENHEGARPVSTV